MSMSGEWQFHYVSGAENSSFNTMLISHWLMSYARENVIVLPLSSYSMLGDIYGDFTLVGLKYIGL
jgi:hypothetical protein